MSEFAKSIQRLYCTGKLTKKQVKERMDKGQITKEEYDEIVA